MNDQSQELIDIILPTRDNSEVLFSRFIGCANAPYIIYKSYLTENNKIEVDVARISNGEDIMMDIPDNLLSKKKKTLLKRVTIGKKSLEAIKELENIFLKKHIREIYDNSLYGEDNE